MNFPVRISAEDTRRIEKLVTDYFRTPPPGPVEFASWIFHLVGRGTMEPEEIAFFLEAAAKGYGDVVAAAAREAGRLEERQMNPALKAFGACVAGAVRRELGTARATAQDTFEALTARGDNAHFAFYEALESIGGEPRKKI